MSEKRPDELKGGMERGKLGYIPDPYRSVLGKEPDPVQPIDSDTSKTSQRATEAEKNAVRLGDGSEVPTRKPEGEDDVWAGYQPWEKRMLQGQGVYTPPRRKP
jgi:hypothetical protein